MTNFHQFHLPKATIGPSRVLAAMLQTGKYYPSAAWAMASFGKGLHCMKLDAIWKSITLPE